MLQQIKKHLFLFSITVTISIAMMLFPAMGSQQTIQDNIDQSAVNIPFEKKSEVYAVSVGRPWWTVKIVLSRDHYFKENLEKIFSYYMKKYPDKRTALTVDVFADAQTYERYIKELPASLGLSEQSQQPRTKDNWIGAHASFLRACDNQFYYYSPDLDNPIQHERVLLKGRWTMGPELRECSQ